MKHDWSTEELAAQWSLLPTEREFLGNKTGATRLGFAVLLKFFQAGGRFPRHAQEVPERAVEYVARQVGVLAAEWLQYQWQGRSIEYHRAQIRSLLGFREASVEDGEALAAWLSEHVLNQDRQMERLKATLMERCRSLHIEPPTQDRIDRLVRSAIHQHEERFCEALLTRLPVGTQARLDALLLPSEHFSYEKGQEPGRSLLSDSKLNATESPKLFATEKKSRSRRIIAREVGKWRLKRIPVAETQPDHSINQRAISVTNLVAVPEDKWQTAVRQFTVLKRLSEMDGIERTRAAVEKVPKILKKHPATIYRWIESYNCSGRLSELLRKNRADRGKSRLSSKVDTIIEDAIKKAVEMNGRRPTPIFATNFLSEQRDLALRGFVSPLGSRARQTSTSGSLGTLALYATPPIQSIRQSWASSGKASMA